MIRPHRHRDLHQVLVTQRGRAEVRLDGRDEALRSPVAIVVPPGVVHSFRFHPDTAGLVISFAPTLSRELSTATAGMVEFLEAPTAVALAPDGRRFVSEKDGTIQVFDSPTDTTPRQVADLSFKVMSAYDRGLEQIVLDPGYPQRPYLYASYTYNARIDAEPQAWPIPEQPEGDTIEDRCRGSYPEPDLGIRDGCQVSGRVAQLKLNARGVVTEENTYQLVRQSGRVGDRVFEIEFDAAGVEAYCFTFG